jgi:hypothetical protein
MNLLIAELGQSVGADLALDDEATATLAIDEDVTVSIRFDEPTDSLVLQTRLETLEPSPARLQRALAANFCWQEAVGAAFGFDPLANQLTLTRHHPSARLDLDSLTAALEGLLNQGQRWTALLGEFASPEPEVEPDTESAPAPLTIVGLRA